ncbi:hypothetical protein EJ05DRAFT_527509 [Pseudovirgaria hyperparasitica]|uniref:Uncharacterized protein n=1 Tax=Pseudovirgaria hyperparasitica TaxID=470096 RepID=A0A6A6W8U9_9PEZI|nr:uncharacterized protein EJ05DRAFT_527509 [Pseudovirgaria hyperparasitica]KAF2759308.1 hypothetical protein EJ05DRAFT_527509 [Pseudovirgaria hyperparasitica]
MLFRTITTTLSALSTTALSLPTPSSSPDTINLSLPSNGRAVEQGIYNIDRETRTLNTAVLAYTPTSSIDPILHGWAEIDRVNRIAYDAAKTSGAFTQPESAAIATAVTRSVGVSIPVLVANVKAKKAEFRAAGYDNSILSALNLILFDHDSFSAATGLRLTVDALPEAGAGAVEVDLAWRDGVAFYADSAA